MNPKKVIKKSGNDKIAEAVRIAEKNTAAEIVTVMTATSSDYIRYSVIAAVIGNFIFTIIIILFTDWYINLIKPFFWDITYHQLIIVTTFIQAIVFLIVYGLFSIPSLKYIIIPKKKKLAEVRTRAESAFYRYNISATAEATGVLIFISFFERRVELLVDYKIAESFHQKDWQQIVNNIINGIKNNTFLETTCQEIIKCGEMLSVHFPIKPDDINELPDAPIIE